MTTYIYGIVRSSHPSPPVGASGIGDPARPVRMVTAGQLSALVSEAPERLRPRRDDLLAHQNVLSEAGEAGPVLPMRFGSTAPDDKTVAVVLEERADHYTERLAALEGKVEFNVKAAHDEEGVLRRVMSDNPELRTLTEANRLAAGGTYEQRLRLGELVVQAVQGRETSDAVAVQRQLERAADEVSLGPQSAGWLANVSFLVSRDAAAEFIASVERLRYDHPHLDLRVNGPLPPYSFVEPGPAPHAAPTAGH